MNFLYSSGELYVSDLLLTTGIGNLCSSEVQRYLQLYNDCKKSSVLVEFLLYLEQNTGRTSRTYSKTEILVQESGEVVFRFKGTELEVQEIQKLLVTERIYSKKLLDTLNLEDTSKKILVESLQAIRDVIKDTGISSKSTLSTIQKVYKKVLELSNRTDIKERIQVGFSDGSFSILINNFYIVKLSGVLKLNKQPKQTSDKTSKQVLKENLKEITFSSSKISTTEFPYNKLEEKYIAKLKETIILIESSYKSSKGEYITVIKWVNTFLYFLGRACSESNLVHPEVDYSITDRIVVKMEDTVIFEVDIPLTEQVITQLKYKYESRTPKILELPEGIDSDTRTQVEFIVKGIEEIRKKLELLNLERIPFKEF